MIYLDNSATTRAFEEAAQAVQDALRENYFNPSAAYGQAIAAQQQAQAVRKAVLNATGRAGEVIFTASGTEADNLAIQGAFTAAGCTGHYITTSVEHPAVLETMQALESRGARVDVLKVDRQGHLSPEALAQAVCEDTVLVSVMHVNNETGAVQDIGALAAAVKAKNPRVLFHSDGVQAFCRVMADQRDVDLYTVSGHKVHAGKGIAALAVRDLKRIRPVIYGGGQEQGYRSGTENMPGIAALGAALEQWALHGEAWRAGLGAMRDDLGARLQAGGGVLNSTSDGAPHIVSVAFAGIRAATLQQALADQDVLVSTGSACKSRGGARVSPVLLAQGIPQELAQSTIRISLSPLNMPREMEQAGDIICAAAARLKRFIRR
ncbi:MAG: cysteine desulfurase family protein [Eubacteriales bacterium]|nr:cysteine desulfurase family protein [Eubacteriales bacterium]